MTQLRTHSSSVLPHRNRHWEEARQQSGSTAELKLSLINKTRLSVLLYYNYTLYYGTDYTQATDISSSDWLSLV